MKPEIVVKCPLCDTEAKRAWTLFIHLRGAHWPSEKNVDWNQMDKTLPSFWVKKIRGYYKRHGR